MAMRDEGDPGRRNALIVAFACEPRKGSEEGAGWGLVSAVNEFMHPIVLVGPLHREGIEQWLAEATGPVPEFVFIDEPWWGSRWHSDRIVAFLSYLDWMRRIRPLIADIVAERDVEVIHHVTYSPYWLPSSIGRFGVPSIWGPIGGAVTTPRVLHRFLGRRGRFTEWFDKIVVRTVDHLPATRRSWREVSLLLLQNEETLARMRPKTSRPCVIFNHGVVHDFDVEPTERSGEPYVVWISRLESRKSPEFAIRAMARATTSARMRIVGDGPERARMEELAADLGIEDRIEFLGRVSHDEAVALMADASAALFTGMREEGGMALAEGLLLGTPTITLDNGGPAIMARAVDDPTRVAVIDTSSAERALTETAEAIDRFTGEAMRPRTPLLDRPAMVERLRGFYESVLPPPDTTDDVMEPIGEPAPLSDEAPRVSVVMPAFNVEPFVREAMRSILDQTFRDLELIVVENGSTDGTRDVIAEVAQTDPRVRAYTWPHPLGAVAPVIHGIQLARAPLVARCDSDDVAAPDRIERQVEFLDENPDVAVVGSNARHIGIDGEVLGLSVAGPPSVEEFRRMRAAGEVTMVLDGTSLLRRDVYDEVGGYDLTFATAAEVDLHCRMAEHGAVVALQEPLLSYRLHGSSDVDSAFFPGRRVHRYVEYREGRRVAGEAAMSFDAFIATEEHSSAWRRLRIRLNDHSQFQYRSAGTALSGGHRIRAATHVIRAALLDPFFVFGRLWERRWSPKARATMKGP